MKRKIKKRDKVAKTSNFKILSLLKRIDFKTWIILILTGVSCWLTYKLYKIEIAPDKGSLSSSIIKCATFLPENMKEPPTFQFTLSLLNTYNSGMTIIPNKGFCKIKDSNETINFYPAIDKSVYLNSGEEKVLTFLANLDSEKDFSIINSKILQLGTSKVFSEFDINLLNSKGETMKVIAKMTQKVKTVVQENDSKIQLILVNPIQGTNVATALDKDFIKTNWSLDH